MCVLQFPLIEHDADNGLRFAETEDDAIKIIL
jgi:hypothetical protein